jgi:hypothetical protein
MNHTICLGLEPFRGRDIAKPRGLSIAGVRDLLGPKLKLTVDLATFAWEHWDEHRVQVVPVAADVTVQGPAGQRGLLGGCPAVAGTIVSPAKGDHDGKVAFLVPLNEAVYERLEGLRNGSTITVTMTATVQIFVQGLPIQFTDFWYQTNVPDKEWTSALTEAGFDDHVWIDVAIPRGPGPKGAGDRLREALAARNRGHHHDAVGKARVAVEAMEQAGFGGHAPKDVIAFVKQGAKKLTSRERLAAVRATVEMLLSPPHHPGADPNEYGRIHSAAALALAAAVISLAEAEGPEPPSP